MTKHHLNALPQSTALPTEAAFGQLPPGTSIESVAATLGRAGIDSSRLHFLRGNGGAEAIKRTGNFISRLLDPNIRDLPIRLLSEGATLVGIYGVDEDDAESVKAAMASIGMTELHYFGRWTYS